MSAQTLARIATLLRRDILTMDYQAGAGHVAGPMGAAELFSVLYFSGVAKLDPTDPWWEERDRIVLSCGHYCPLLYAALARARYFPVDELATFMQLDSRLTGHPERRFDNTTLPGVEVTTGPLGQGVSVATGIALALRHTYGNRSNATIPRTWCVLSDGELQEGQTWEAFQFAVRQQLANITYIVDANKIQIERYTSEVVSGDVAAKLEGFGLRVFEVDGNDVAAVTEILERVRDVQDEPTIVVSHTVAGRGVTFMENKPVWHDKALTGAEYAHALQELGDA